MPLTTKRSVDNHHMERRGGQDRPGPSGLRDARKETRAKSGAAHIDNCKNNPSDRRPDPPDPPASPVPSRRALAAAGRNPTDITLTTAGSRAVGPVRGRQPGRLRTGRNRDGRQIGRRAGPVYSSFRFSGGTSPFGVPRELTASSFGVALRGAPLLSATEGRNPGIQQSCWPCWGC
jgi:hypothetical protein